MSDRFDFTDLPALTTERLTLRPITSNDRGALFDIFSDADVTRFSPVQRLESVNGADKLIDAAHALFEQQRGLRWGITMTGGAGTLIGVIGFDALDHAHHYAALGFALGRAHRGQAILTEAVGGVNQFGFERLALNRVEALVETGNQHDMAVLATNGFHHEGTLRQRAYWKNAYHDLVVYSLLRAEWESATVAISLRGDQD